MRFRVRPWTNDFLVLVEILDEKVYTQRDWDLPARPTIVDVGAYIGDFSVLAKELWPDSRVYAFEPNPANFTLLEENVILNGCTDVRVFRSAVAGQAGVRTLVGGDSRDMSFLKSGSSGLDVEAVCLQDVIPGNIDLLKMDCEGAEYEILESMAATGHLSKVRAAALEWHHYPGGEGLSDLLELLDGFSLQTLEYHDTGDSGILYAWR